MIKKLLILLTLMFLTPFVVNAEELKIEKMNIKNNFDDVEKVINTFNEEYIVAGSVGHSKGYIAKYDNNMNFIWDNTYEESTKFLDVVSEDDDITVIGQSTNDLKYSFIIKYDANGEMLWKKEFENIYFELIKNVNDGYIVIGRNNNYSVINIDALIIKFDKNGNILWEDMFGGPSRDEFEKIIITKDNEYIVLGNSSSNIEGLNKCGWDGMIIKYNSDGEIVWKNSWTDEENEYEEDDGYVCSEDYFYSFYINKENEIIIFSNRGMFKYNLNGELLLRNENSDVLYNFYETSDEGLMSIRTEENGDESDIFLKKYDKKINLVFEYTKHISLGNAKYISTLKDGCFVINEYEKNISKYCIQYDIKNTPAEKGKFTIEQHGLSGIITPLPDKGYEVDKVIVKDKEGNALDIEVTQQEDGTFIFPLYTDVSVEVLFKETLVNPKTGLFNYIGLLLSMLICSFLAFWFIMKKDNKYEL